ncbi:MAG: Queuine tRNA-ribosyltransferase [Acidobacteria bacterium ADurb.Bin051]|nr:MAG: Queuine tRNA-ribosyltransferase [Acidobacteria bacterium ADurb.Bin051]
MSAFVVAARDGRARTGRLATAHGTIHTPAFMPVGTLGAVKGLGPWQLEQLGAEVMLCNLYHLALRPGVATIAGLGGLHAFTGWSGPLLTDSGGFQVWSLAHLRAVDEDGVTFRSHLDGAPLRFTPEGVAGMQAALGVDIAMVLDECPPAGAPRARLDEAALRTRRWAERARVSVGEPLADRRAQVEWTAPALPEGRPRYLMGVGTPADLLHAVGHGVDLFDCVLPARNGRHGLLYTRTGLVRIRNARHAAEGGPLDPECACPVCRRLSRAFLHHLFRAGEVTAPVLGALHNLRFFLDFMGDLREAISSGRLAELAATVASPDPVPDDGATAGTCELAGDNRSTTLGEG